MGVFAKKSALVRTKRTWLFGASILWGLGGLLPTMMFLLVDAFFAGRVIGLVVVYFGGILAMGPPASVFAFGRRSVASVRRPEVRPRL